MCFFSTDLLDGVGGKALNNLCIILCLYRSIQSFVINQQVDYYASLHNQLQEHIVQNPVFYSIPRVNYPGGYNSSFEKNLKICLV